MRCAIHGLVAAALLACLALPAVAAEPYLEFADGLRKRDLHDVAVEFLEKAETDPKCPPEVKEVIPYEKAMILLDGAKYVKNLEQQTKQLDQAEYWLKSWTAPVVRFLSLGTINPRRLVAKEVAAALEAVAGLMNASLYAVALQAGLRLAFGVSLWTAYLLQPA